MNLSLVQDGSAGPVLHDTVTLRHFASVGRLDIVKAVHGNRPEPRWTDEIQVEVEFGESLGERHCTDILTAEWLGPAAYASVTETRAVFRLQRRMTTSNRSGKRNLGEAEGIYFAKKYAGQFATDDNDAYKFASQRENLGPLRVIDSIDILRAAVKIGYITAQEAAKIADSIEAAGRAFRPVHRIARDADYFLPRVAIVFGEESRPLGPDL